MCEVVFVLLILGQFFCVLNAVKCFILFMFAFMFATPAQGEPGGVNQSASGAEAGQIQWRSECLSFSFHPAH